MLDWLTVHEHAEHPHHPFACKIGVGVGPWQERQESKETAVQKTWTQMENVTQTLYTPLKKNQTNNGIYFRLLL